MPKKRVPKGRRRGGTVRTGRNCLPGGRSRLLAEAASSSSHMKGAKLAMLAVFILVPPPVQQPPDWRVLREGK